VRPGDWPLLEPRAPPVERSNPGEVEPGDREDEEGDPWIEDPVCVQPRSRFETTNVE
jgi:hypothetical protein